MAHWMQLIADEIDPAWVLEGENADSVPPGIVPKGGQIIPAGTGNHIVPLSKGVNLYPVAELVSSIWEHYYRITGLSPIMFGEIPGAQTSGRAVAIQIEAAANRLDPKRRLLYAGLHELLVFWTIMAERMNPKFPVGVAEDGTAQYAGVKEIVGDFRRWKIIPPEITPRDVYENTNNEINKVQSKLSSLKTSMDQLGIDSPEDELKLIQEEQMNAQLNPASVQAYVSLLPIIQQVMAQQQAMEQQLAQLQQAPGGNVAQSQSAVNSVQQAQYAAQPSMQAEDMNQPMTQAGMPPPGNGQGPAVQTLVRDGQALNQVAYRGS
jgi:hypothetical protein